jgi:carboxylesterase type B
MSGTECLNLNITVPDIKVEIEKRLPVMVFVHGGGYIMGANYWPQYDLSLLVKMSVEMGVPVIGVNIK